jgi:protein phosphatase
MGTTVVAALMAGNRIHLGALGDSRAYLVGAHGVAPLTYDQNLKSMQLRMYMGGRKVEWGEQGHALVGFLGHFDNTARPALPNVFQKTVSLLPGEWLILCSDGFSDYAGADEGAVVMLIRRAIQDAILAPEGNVPMEVARALVLAANRGGGGDNITVLAITLSAEQPATNEEKPIASSGEEADATEHYT